MGRDDQKKDSPVLNGTSGHPMLDSWTGFHFLPNIIMYKRSDWLRFYWFVRYADLIRMTNVQV
jgi:hypothetical protein